MRTIINAAFIQGNSSLLLLFKGDVWILPGGKQNPGESYYETLRRELRKELPRSRFAIDGPYGEFQGKIPHGNEIIQVKVFHARIDGNITPAAEISDARYLKMTELANIPISEITRQIIDSLINQGDLV